MTDQSPSQPVISTDANPHACLRVTHLTLYSHGVASLTLRAKVEGNAQLTLSFLPTQMNDILKSLTAIDESADGNISSICYDSPKVSHPMIISLEEDEAALHSVISGACGSKVALYFAIGRREIGTLVGLQKDMTYNDDGNVTKTKIHIILNQEGILSHYELQDVRNIQFKDADFCTRLSNTLRSKFASRDDSQKQVTIFAKGEGKRNVVVNYAVESPVYKLTYRFLLENEDSDKDCVYVHGWAIIDNPSQQDLEDVKLTVVSGLPISFRHNLYGARFVERPEEMVNNEAAYGAPSMGNIHFRRRKQLAVKSARKGAARLRDRDRDVLRGGPTSSSHSDEDDDVQDTERDIGGDNEISRKSARTEQVGNLFEYVLKERVSIRGGQSALVPLIETKCPGGRVSVYSRRVRDKNTLAAVRLKNGTKAAFESGPASVYEKKNGRLVGEAMVESCRPGAQVFLPFSVELDCEARYEKKSGGATKTVLLTVVDGVVRVTKATQQVEVYRFDNWKSKEMNLEVLHEIEGNYEVRKAFMTLKSNSADADEGGDDDADGGRARYVEAAEIKDRKARFQVDIPAGYRCTLTVKSQHKWMESKTVSNICGANRAMLAKLESEGAVDETMMTQFRAVIETQTAISKLENEVDRNQKEISQLIDSQRRIRENIASLSNLNASSAVKDNQLLARYLQSLGESEDKIESLQSLIDSAKLKIAEEQELLRKQISEVGKSL